MSAGRPKTILLVEDDDLIALAEAQTIESFGYTVLTATSGEKAVEIACSDETVSLILMDIELRKGISGAEAAKKILNNRAIPIVFVTSPPEREMLERVRGIARYGCVIKNSGDAVLRSSIEMALELFEAHQSIGSKMNALENSRTTAEQYLNLVAEIVVSLDTRGTVVLMNSSGHRLLGYDPDELVGRSWFDVCVPERFREETRSAFEDLMRGDIANAEVHENPVLTKHGDEKVIRWHNTLIKDARGNVSESLSSGQDITEQRQLETYWEMVQEVLRLLHEPGDLRGSIRRVLAVVKARTGLDAVGIRLKAGDDFPYFVQEGFPEDFLVTEDSLIERGRDDGVRRDGDGKISLKCTCGLVISATFDTSHSFFTRGGSFWTNDFAPLHDLPLDQDPGQHPPNQCIHHGYASVALLPIRSEDHIVGLLQLNDLRKGRFTPAAIAQLEAIAVHIGEMLTRKQVEEELQGERDRLDLAVTSTGLGLYDWNPKTGTVHYSESWAAMFGYRVDELPANVSAWSERVHPDDMPVSRKATQDAFRDDTPYICEYRVRHRDGSWRWILDQGRIVARDAQGEVIRFVGANLDITDRKLAESELRRTRKEFVDLFDEAPVGYHEIDKQGIIVRINSTELRMLGYTAEELERHPVWTIAADQELSRQAVLEKLSGNLVPAHLYERLVRRKDGSTFTAMMEDIILRGEDGHISGIRTTVQDITERKEAERFSETLYGISQAIHAANDLVECFGHIHHALSAVMPAQNLFIALLTEDEKMLYFPYHSDEQRFAPNFSIAIDAPQSLTAEVFRSKRSLLLNEKELSDRYASGRNKVWVSAPKCWLGVPLLIKEKACGVLSVQDYTREDVYSAKIVSLFESVASQIAIAIERKRSEEMLKQSVSLLQATLESIVEGILVVEKSGRIISYNKQFVEMWNLPRDIIESRDDDRALNHVLSQLKEPEEFMSKVRALYECPDEDSFDVLEFKDGRICERYSLPHRVDGKSIGRVWSFRDVTARKKAEHRNRLLAHSVSSTKDCVSIADLQDRIIFVNGAFLQTYGYALEDLVGKPVSILRSAKTSSEIGNGILTGTQDGGWYGEIINRRKDGSEFPIELWTSVVKDENDKVIATVGVARDITERKRYESDRDAAAEDLHKAMHDMRETNILLEQATARANLMAVQAEQANISKSQFLATMSHEIRTPMNGVIGMTGLLLDSKLSGEQRQYAEMVRTSGEALLALINDILDFSKIEARKLELEILEFDLRAVLEDTAELLALKAQEKGLDLVCLIEPDVPLLLRGDPGRLRQILLNLGGNAVKFTPRGRITLRVSLESEEERQATVRIAVTDTGIGIPSAEQEKLFSPFVQVDGSTSRKYGGTGLGLAISKQLVGLMGGAIGIESSSTALEKNGEAGGSTFWFTAVFGKQDAGQTPQAMPTIDLSGVRILVVDDNEINRLLVTTWLKKWGCRFAETADGQLALERLSEAVCEEDPFDVALLDMQMPGMDGAELGRTIKATQEICATRLVMMTSLGGLGERDRLTALGFAGFLTKPLRQSQMHECIAIVSGLVEPTPGAPGQSLAGGAIESKLRNRRARILLAEDNAINQMVALKILGRLGYRTDAVANGEEVIKALEIIPYDLVLMDCQMPEMDGFEATRAIRKMKIDIPIIALTANAMKGDRELCLEAGMNDYLSKPVKSVELAAILDRWLKLDLRSP